LKGIIEEENEEWSKKVNSIRRENEMMILDNN
jgi:hypothetical protein